MRHDGQHGDNHRGDEPYTIRDAVAFCQEMNAELLCGECSEEGYLAQLRRDEFLFDTLMERLAQCPAGIGNRT